jgi:diaminohydroxyphosphoribosylaminopyrimidine deaminase/5-amino-6-(5-phosphoribosylamino)uracil reductase
MAEAIRLGARGTCTTHPNPNVGCVIVQQGEIVGRGWHPRAGEPHAEVFALEEAGERARGADVFVTLEPCSHHGRTPPCADALIEAGVKRVVAAMQDPNPKVAGEGLAKLQKAGIDVETGLLAEQAAQLNPGFLSRWQRGRPYVRLKLAASLDGRTAMASGESRWITGAAARQDVQRLRARSSAVVTGVGTILADNPSMNVRLDAQQLHSVEPVRQPLRVVLDSQLRLPHTANILTLQGGKLVITGKRDKDAWQALENEGAEVALVACDENGRLQPAAVLELLAQRDINEVLLECGPTVAGSFMGAGLVDELVLYLAPHLMGDAARGLFTIPGLEEMQDRIALEWIDVRKVGEDLRITARPERAK